MCYGMGCKYEFGSGECAYFAVTGSKEPPEDTACVSSNYDEG